MTWPLVKLELHDRRRGSGDDKYSWMPAGSNDEFDGGWWDAPPYVADDPHFVKMARIEVDGHTGTFATA